MKIVCKMAVIQSVIDSYNLKKSKFDIILKRMQSDRLFIIVYVFGKKTDAGEVKFILKFHAIRKKIQTFIIHERIMETQKIFEEYYTLYKVEHFGYHLEKLQNS